MNWRWITGIDEFKAISLEWDKLLLQSGEDNPFLLSTFLVTWWKYFSAGIDLRILVFYQNQEMVGGMPLCLNNCRLLEYPGGVAANYTEPLCLEANRNLIWISILDALEQKDDWKSFCLKRIRREKFTVEKIDKEVCDRKKILCDLYSDDHAYLAKIPHDFSRFLYQLPRNLRYYVRRSEKELSKLGIISLHIIREPVELDSFLDTFFSFSVVSFNKRNSKSLFENPKFRGFFRELAKKFLQEGVLDAQALMLEKKAIAIHFGYSLGKNMNYVFPAFDTDYADLNPGHLMIYKLFELGSKIKNAYFDFYSGYSFYKKQWSDIKEEVLTLKIYSLSVSGRVKHFLKKRLRKVFPTAKIKKKLRVHRKLSKFANKLKALMQKTNDA